MNNGSRPYDIEELKERLVRSDPNFYLVPARNPGNTFQVLWYQLPGRDGQSSSGSRRCKVDILLTGSEPLAIPFIPPDRIKYHPSGSARQSQIPLLPLLPLILLKVQGWLDHRDDDLRPWMKSKVPQDEQDLRRLLELAYNSENFTRMKEDLGWLEGWFVNKAETWVKKYVDEWEDSALDWAVLGFPEG